MSLIDYEPGDVVLARTAYNEWVQRRVITKVMHGDDFLVVHLCMEEEWENALSEGRSPTPIVWPAEDVRALKPAPDVAAQQDPDYTEADLLDALNKTTRRVR